MHNLEKRIAEWRKTMTARPAVHHETLEELENHLRETVDELVRSGTPEAEAFQLAVAQLGRAPMIASEFQKLNQGTWLPVRVITCLGAVGALALAILLLARFDAGRTSFLLASHVFLVTLGYSTTFLLGALGICFVGQRCFSDFSPIRMRSLSRVTFILGGAGAVLTLAGVILAMIWAKAAWGRYWAWDVKETGAFAVTTWQICFLVAHRLPGVTARHILLMSLFGNIVVGAGWFGVNLLSRLHQYGTPTSWVLLLAAVVSNFAFFLIGLAPAGWVRQRKIS
jgi:hypothetical protein